MKCSKSKGTTFNLNCNRIESSFFCVNICDLECEKISKMWKLGEQ